LKPFYSHLLNLKEFDPAQGSPNFRSGSKQNLQYHSDGQSTAKYKRPDQVIYRPPLRRLMGKSAPGSNFQDQFDPSNQQQHVLSLSQYKKYQSQTNTDVPEKIIEDLPMESGMCNFELPHLNDLLFNIISDISGGWSKFFLNAHAM
jgi:hypothetical protein